MLTATQIDHIKDIIVEKADPLKIILFGSYANGNADDSSDLDILIIKETDLPRPKRAVEIRKHLYGLVDTGKDILVYTPAEIEEWENVKHSFVNTVLTSGQVIYEK